jgi:argininosuccinate synthase
MSTKRIALAYSGGLDTSCIVPWLKENIPGAEVVCVVGDVGQGSDELAGVDKKAKDSGAVECHIVDLKKEFVDEFVMPTMIAGAKYEGRYLLGTAIARPVLARGQVIVAKQTGCTALAHGCTGKGNDQVRFESAYAALAPDQVPAALRAAVLGLPPQADIAEQIEALRAKFAAGG